MKTMGKAIVVVFVGLAANGWAQGSLTPPGAPAPTMKTLTEINTAVEVVQLQNAQLQTQVDGLSSQQQSQIAGLSNQLVAVDDRLVAVGANVMLAYWQAYEANHWAFEAAQTSYVLSNTLAALSVQMADQAKLISDQARQIAALTAAHFPSIAAPLTVVVDATFGAGYSTSLAFTPAGRPAISYSIQTVDSEGTVGESSSLAFTPSGNPAISYFDSSNKHLKYAEIIQAP